MNYDLHEQQISDHLIARGLFGLFEQLQGLKGHALNHHYRLRWLYALGGQSILYLAADSSGQLAIAKMPFLNYHRPAYVSNDDIHRARQRLEREAILLERFRGSTLPQFYDLIYNVNPLHSALRGEEIFGHEPYLVMEFIQGQTLAAVARRIHRVASPAYEVLELLAWQTLETIVDFFIMLSKQEAPYLYVDVTPTNIFLTQSQEQSVRILDAGSLIPLQEEPAISPPFTKAYIPPEYCEAYDKGIRLWPTPVSVMYSLGKALWEVLTNRQPFSAKDPDLSEPKLKQYSPVLQRLLLSLVERQYQNFSQLKEAISSRHLPKKRAKVNWSELLDTHDEPPIERSVLTPPAPRRGSPASIVADAEQLIEIRRVQIGRIQALRYSPDNHYLAIARDNRLELLDARTLHQISSFPVPNGNPIVSMDFDLTGKFLASGSQQLLCLWSIFAGGLSLYWQHSDSIFTGSIALDGQGTILGAATKWGAVTFQPQFSEEGERRFDGLVDQCTCTAIAKHRSLLAVGGLGGIRLWDLLSRSEVGQCRVGRGRAVWQIAFSEDDKALAALVSDTQTPYQYSIFVWDIPTCRSKWQGTVPPATHIRELSIHFIGRFLCAGSSDGNLWIWDQEQMLESVHFFDSGQISALDFASNHQEFAVATADGELRIYQLHL